MTRARDIANLVDANGDIVAGALDNANDASALTTGTLPVDRVPYLTNRNLIINGDFVIDQRNSGSSITPTNGQFSADRWKCSLSQASKFSVQQVTDAPVGFQNSVKLTSLSAYTPVSNDYFLIQQQLEGYTGAHLLYGTANAKTATLSFYVKSSLTGTFGGAIRNSNGYNRTYPFEYTINSANTWEKKTITFAGDTSGTYLTTNGAGITTTFSIGAGANFKSTANAWAANNDIAGSNATDVVATNGATWQITGVKLEGGSIATDFVHESYGDTLAKCQRYFQNNIFAYEGIENDTEVSGVCYYKQTMRAAPSLSHVNVGGNATALAGLLDRYQAQCQWWLNFGAGSHYTEKLITANAEL